MNPDRRPVWRKYVVLAAVAMALGGAAATAMLLHRDLPAVVVQGETNAVSANAYRALMVQQHRLLRETAHITEEGDVAFQRILRAGHTLRLWSKALRKVIEHPGYEAGLSAPQRAMIAGVRDTVASAQEGQPLAAFVPPVPARLHVWQSLPQTVKTGEVLVTERARLAALEAQLGDISARVDSLHRLAQNYQRVLDEAQATVNDALSETLIPHAHTLTQESDGASAKHRDEVLASAEDVIASGPGQALRQMGDLEAYLALVAAMVQHHTAQAPSDEVESTQDEGLEPSVSNTPPPAPVVTPVPAPVPVAPMPKPAPEPQPVPPSAQTPVSPLPPATEPTQAPAPAPAPTLDQRPPVEHIVFPNVPYGEDCPGGYIKGSWGQSSGGPKVQYCVAFDGWN